MTVPSGWRLAKIQTVELALSFYSVQATVGDCWGRQWVNCVSGVG